MCLLVALLQKPYYTQPTAFANINGHIFTCKNIRNETHHPRNDKENHENHVNNVTSSNTLSTVSCICMWIDGHPFANNWLKQKSNFVKMKSIELKPLAQLIEFVCSIFQAHHWPGLVYSQSVNGRKAGKIHMIEKQKKMAVSIRFRWN